MRMPLITIAALLLCPSPPPAEAAADRPPAAMAPELPGGEWQGLPPAAGVIAPDPAWSRRTGLRKGVREQSLQEEKTAGPDAAVLRSGAFAEWTGLLAAFQESAFLADPEDIAGLAATKPLLIIPSGGLDGLSGSDFFRAGIAGYVRSGGVVLCFAQRRGADFAALPVPEDATHAVSGMGWSEESGPLYRASAVQAIHPVLAGLQRATPAVETDGYLTISPSQSTVLLARADGFPTLALYPVGNGWVAVTSLFSEVSFVQGLLSDDEKTLVANLIAWAKAGGRMAQYLPGNRLTAQLAVQGADRETAAGVKVIVSGSRDRKPRDERILPMSVETGKTVQVPFDYWIPADTPSGVYQLEYLLTDGKKRAITPAAETSSAFAVIPKMPAPAHTPRQQPLAPFPVRISVQPVMERTGERSRLTLEIARTGGPAGNYDLLVRAADQEQVVKMTGDRTTVAVTLSAGSDALQVPYGVYHSSGRSLGRGSLRLGPRQAGGLSADRNRAAPGEKVRISVSGIGPGAVTITGLGTVVNEHISANKAFEITVPSGLPAGAYPLSWEFQPRAGEPSEGTIPLIVAGLRARSTGLSLREDPAGKAGAIAVLRIQADDALAASLTLRLHSPSGGEVQTVEKTLALTAGPNEMSVPVHFKPDAAGIWDLRYAISTRLPEGPGYPAEPLVLNAGRLLFDRGTAAVLGLGTDRPVYYEPAGAVALSASAHFASEGRLDLLLDGKRVKREKVPAAGAASVTYTAEELARGAHTIVAVASAGGMENRRETRVLFGARLPDLSVTIKTSELKAPAMEVGVGVMNLGKTASEPTVAALYEGDPDRGGTLIQSFGVPALEPGKQFVMVIPWSLAGKAGLRTLTAVADPRSAGLETDRKNNTALSQHEIPDVLLAVIPRQNAFTADVEVSYQVAVANFTAAVLRSLTLALEVVDPDGRTVATESLPLPELPSGGVRQFDRSLNVGIPQEGVYLVSAQVSADRPLVSDSVGITILPTLQLAGTLESVPAAAAPCRPLNLRYTVRNAGNLPPTSGSLKLEVRSRALGQLVHAIQVPFTLGERTHSIGKIDFPRGDYLVSLKASVVHQPTAQQKDFLLAELPLVVKGPVQATSSPAAVPRLLVWAGSEEGSAIERALPEKMLNEAFEQERIFSKIVSSLEDFQRHALTGLYNTYLLLDIDALLDTGDLLANLLAKGHSVIIAGSGERPRSLAEQFGFRFDAVAKTSHISFRGDAGLDLSGTIPVSRPAFSPHRSGAKVLATFPDDRPAILLASEGPGALAVIPFSLVRSSLDAGTSTVYSLLLRSLVLSLSPAQEEGGTISTVRLMVSSPAGPAKTRIIQPLPPGVKVLWANQKRRDEQNTATFDLTAEETPQTVLYLLQSDGPESRRVAAEIQFECDGKFVSQGKIE